MCSVDDEWKQYILNQPFKLITPSIYEPKKKSYIKTEQQPVKNNIQSYNDTSVVSLLSSVPNKGHVDKEQQKNIENNDLISKKNTNKPGDTLNEEIIFNNNAPVCDELNISTSTKVLFLNQEIDLYNIFWKLPIINYWTPECGIIKKQTKIKCITEEDYNDYCLKKEQIKEYFNENILKQINNPDARRIKFKDERKITVGISKKDILNCRGKIKQAFYNCIVLIIRYFNNNIYNEMHIKIFNTGKIEIPGILNMETLEIAKKLIIKYLQPYINNELIFVDTNNDEKNVLINSNYNCGFSINLKILDTLLKNKYSIETSCDYDHYPGLKCKFYYNNNLLETSILQNGLINSIDRTQTLEELNNNKKYTKVNIMIFRSGCILIMGNFSNKILNFTYEYIQKILKTEYNLIALPEDTKRIIKNRKKNIKKNIFLSQEYLTKINK
jgi:TATA-box binding protein (TBP) (component of TFIID and TFIIIB)